jgi:sugar phosphate isomerase/epimerase
VSPRLLCLAQLSLIDLAPPELVRVAAGAGFGGVLVRLQKTSDGRGHDVLGDQPTIEATKRAIADTGVRVWDTEVIRLKPEAEARDYERLMEVSAHLGASYVLTTVEDDEHARALHNFAELCDLASAYGLACSLEFMVFSKVRTLDDGIALITGSGAANANVLIDSLHLFRSGGSAADVARVVASHPELIRYIQLCDAADSAAAPSEASAREEASYARLVPGDGVLPLAQLIGVLPPNCPLSVEAPPVAAAGKDPLTFARQLFHGTQQVLSAVIS